MRLRIRPILLAQLDQLQHLLDTEDRDLGDALHKEVFVSRLVDRQRTLAHAVGVQQIIHELIVYLQVTDADLELAAVRREALVHGSVVRVQLLDSVEQVLHGEDENAGVLVSVIDVALVLDEPNAILLLGCEREVTPLL